MTSPHLMKFETRKGGSPSASSVAAWPFILLPSTQESQDTPYFSGSVVLRNCLGTGQWLAGTLGPTQSHQLLARLLAWLAPTLVAGGGGRVRGSSESGLGCYGDNCANDTQVHVTISSSTEHFLITAAPMKPPHTVWHSPILQSGTPRPRGATVQV